MTVIRITTDSQCMFNEACTMTEKAGGKATKISIGVIDCSIDDDKKARDFVSHFRNHEHRRDYKVEVSFNDPLRTDPEPGEASDSLLLG